MVYKGDNFTACQMTHYFNEALLLKDSKILFPQGIWLPLFGMETTLVASGWHDYMWKCIMQPSVFWLCTDFSLDTIQIFGTPKMGDFHRERCKTVQGIWLLLFGMETTLVASCWHDYMWKCIMQLIKCILTVYWFFIGYHGHGHYGLIFLDFH